MGQVTILRGKHLTVHATVGVGAEESRSSCTGAVASRSAPTGS